jgi:hypothetical protein
MLWLSGLVQDVGPHLSDTSVTSQCPPFVYNLRTCPPSYMPTSPPPLDVAFYGCRISLSPSVHGRFSPRPSPSHVPTISSTSQRHLSDIPMPAFRTQPSHVPTPSAPIESGHSGQGRGVPPTARERILVIMILLSAEEPTFFLQARGRSGGEEGADVGRGRGWPCLWGGDIRRKQGALRGRAGGGSRSGERVAVLVGWRYPAEARYGLGAVRGRTAVGEGDGCD